MKEGSTKAVLSGIYLDNNFSIAIFPGRNTTQFAELLKAYFDKGFRIAKAKVDFMVYWKDEEKQQEVLVVLPRLLLVR